MDCMVPIETIDQRSKYIVLWDKLGGNPFISPFMDWVSI
jgi:hypothetical protein